MTLPATIVLALAAANPADLVIENARIWSDGLPALATFAAIEDGRFVYVGSPDDAYIGRGTRKLNASGRVIVPGLIDSHVHMLGGGQGLNQLQLRDVTSKAEFVAHVRGWARSLDAHGADAWIRGGRWSTESWANPEAPTRQWIDEASGGHPLYLPRMDGHSALVNSKALELAGITAQSPPDPEGGVIDRDPVSGEPTGILRESAMGLVSGLIPESSVTERTDALRLAIREANRHGITAVADIPGIDDLAAYEQLTDDELTVRFFLYPTADDWAGAVEHVRDFPERPGWMRINGLKTYLDGSLGSRTAYMREPFLGNDAGHEHWRGLLREGVDGGRLRRKLEAARDAGLQAIAHAIGDEANHLLLDTLAIVHDDLPAARARSEHAQHLVARDIVRFGNLGVIASMQPYHKADDGRYAESYLGAVRCASSYAYRSLLDAGAVVAFGSDWPVVSINPFLGIEAAVTGRTLDGRSWQTQECITIGEALRCYTSRGAYGVFAEREIGRIAPGYRADFVILSRSPFDPDVKWDQIRPLSVYVEGRVVRSR
ncbi:MAG: amidohydrolase [Planctomycetes bacterium]|nr:amidohydrolase [Planctomycetota bacterium]